MTQPTNIPGDPSGNPPIYAVMASLQAIVECIERMGAATADTQDAAFLNERAQRIRRQRTTIAWWADQQPDRGADWRP